MTKIIMIGDFAKDLDDEHSLILAGGLHKQNEIELIGVIANLHPAIGRAQVAKGTLNEMGLDDIPVAIGTPVFNNSVEYPYERSVPYKSSKLELHPDGQVLLTKLLSTEENKSITIVLQSGMTDMFKFLLNDKNKLYNKIKEVVIMGGVQSKNDNVYLTGHYIQPDDANNITYDWTSGVSVYAKLQELKIPMVIVTRNAAYGCPIPFSMYDKLEGVVGKCLKSRQEPWLEHLWKAANAKEGDDIRGTLPPRCNREWFVSTFCNNNDPGDVDSIWKYVGTFNLYDPINLVAAIPKFRKKYFNSTIVKVKGVNHIVIGISTKNNGIQEKYKLRDFIINTEVNALK